MRTKVIVLVFLFSFLALPGIAPAQENGQTPLPAPETIEDAQEFGLGILKALPDAVKKVWEEQVVPLWTGIWNWVKSVWDSTIYSFARGIWDRVLALFGQEIEQRKPFIEEEFAKEKEELKQEIEERIPEPGKTLWERVKGFLPGNEKE